MKPLASALALLLCVGLGAIAAESGPVKCHSQLFTQAKKKLQRMTLTRAQQDSLKTYESTFRENWRATHRRVGCSAHERHAEEFVAAAAGVLTDAQFKTFRGRDRHPVETTRHQLWRARSYADDLIKLASR